MGWNNIPGIRKAGQAGRVPCTTLNTIMNYVPTAFLVRVEVEPLKNIFLTLWDGTAVVNLFVACGCGDRRRQNVGR